MHFKITVVHFVLHCNPLELTCAACHTSYQHSNRQKKWIVSSYDLENKKKTTLQLHLCLHQISEAFQLNTC